MAGEARPKTGTVAIERDGQMVRIEIMADDTYAAMEIYDRAIASARRGRLEVIVITGGVTREH